MEEKPFATNLLTADEKHLIDEERVGAAQQQVDCLPVFSEFYTRNLPVFSNFYTRNLRVFREFYTRKSAAASQ